MTMTMGITTTTMITTARGTEGTKVRTFELLLVAPGSCKLHNPAAASPEPFVRPLWILKTEALEVLYVPARRRDPPNLPKESG